MLYIVQVNPQRVIVLRGRSEADYLGILKHARDGGHEGFCPVNGEKVTFTATGGIAKIALPPSIRSDTMKRVRDSGCMLRSVKAGIQQDVISLDGSMDRLDRQQFSLLHFEHQEKIQEGGLMDVGYGLNDANKNDDGVEDVETSTFISEPLCLHSLSDKLSRKHSLGRISFGEVKLTSLKTRLGSKRTGSHDQPYDVEYKLGTKGATILCSNQLTVQKVNENDFLIEAAPGTLFSDTRDIVYSKFSYL